MGKRLNIRHKVFLIAGVLAGFAALPPLVVTPEMVLAEMLLYIYLLPVIIGAIAGRPHEGFLGGLLAGIGLLWFKKMNISPVKLGLAELVLLTGLVIVGRISQILAKEHLDQKEEELSLSNARLEEAQREVTRLNAEVDKGIFDLLAIFEFTSVLGSTLNLAEMLDTIVDWISRIVKYDACWVMLANEETGRLETRVTRGITSDQIKTYEMEFQRTVADRVVQTAQPVFLENLSDYAIRWARDLGFKSLSSFPLVVHGKAIGVLTVFKKEVRGFTQDEQRTLFIMTNQAAFAVQNGHLYEEMAVLAITDGLTGLYNHRHFRSSIDQAARAAEETGQPLSMLMVDLDYFKAINDRYGHLRGDQVLREVGQLIRSNVRETDLVARYGGEEFAVILPETMLKDAVKIAERINRSIAEHDFDKLRLTASIGVATFPTEMASTKDELISLADQNAYLAKQGGRNRVCAQG